MAVWACKECSSSKPCIIDDMADMERPNKCPWDYSHVKWTSRQDEQPKHKDMQFIKDKLYECLRRLE